MDATESATESDLLLERFAEQLDILALTVPSAHMRTLFETGSVSLPSGTAELQRIWCRPAVSCGTLLAFEVKIGNKVAIIFVAAVLGRCGGLGKGCTIVCGECCPRARSEEVDVAGCRIQRGLWWQHQRLGDVQQYIEEELAPRQDGGDIWLVGGSQGAALASLAFWRATRPGGRRDLRLLSVAMPRVGCPEFVRQLSTVGPERLLLARVAGDPVPLLPPWTKDWLADAVLRGRTVVLGEGEDCFARWPCLAPILICRSWPRKHSTGKRLFPKLLRSIQGASSLPSDSKQAAAAWESFWQRGASRGASGIKSAVFNAAVRSRHNI